MSDNDIYNWAKFTTNIIIKKSSWNSFEATEKLTFAKRKSTFENCTVGLHNQNVFKLVSHFLLNETVTVILVLEMYPYNVIHPSSPQNQQMIMIFSMLFKVFKIIRCNTSSYQ